MKKAVIKLVTLALAGLLLVGAIATTTLGWFYNPGSIGVDKISGTILTNYFHTGNGTKDHPFVITRPIHYYNLVNLYQRVDGYSDNHYYFQVGYPLDPDDKNTMYVYEYDENNSEVIDETTGKPKLSKTLNMEYYSGDHALLPIGTAENPFLGVFDGKGITLSGFTVGVNWTDSTGKFGDPDRCDIGIFGYIGEGVNLDESVDGDGNPTIEGEELAAIRDVFFDKVTIDLTGALVDLPEGHADANHKLYQKDPKSGEISAVSNDLHVWVGYLAGHIIQSAQVEGVYVNNVTVKGGGTAYSSFGYFGCVENTTSGNAITLGSEYGTQFDAGNEQGWGGSLDMKQMYTRLYNTRNGNVTGYITGRTVTVDELLNTKTVADTTGGTLGNNIHFYRTDGAGYVINTGVGNTYQFIYGFTNPTNVVTVTYKKDSTTGDYQMIPALLIKSGSFYLGTGDGTHLNANTTVADKGYQWMSDDAGHLYTYYGDDYEKKFLNATVGAGLSLGATGTTVWTRTANDELTFQAGETTYYLVLKNGNWTFSSITEGYKISDGQGHYISCNQTNVSANSEAGATIFALIENGNTVRIYTETDGTKYYLQGNGTLSVGTASFTWTNTSGALSTQVQGVPYYLVHDGSSFDLKPASGYILGSGTHYIKLNGTTVGDTTDPSQATVWQKAGTDAAPQYWTVINGQKYYLNHTGETLNVTTATKPWTARTNGLVETIGNVDAYSVGYDNGWKAKWLGNTRITDGSGNYLQVTGTGNTSFQNATNANNATLWLYTDGRLIAQYNNTPVYLRNNNGTLQLNTTAQNGWTNDANNFKNGTYYLIYQNGSWKLNTNTNVTDTYYVIKIGDYYISATGTTLGRDQNINNALQWSSDSGQISTVINNTVYYLNGPDSNNSAVTLTTTQNGNNTSWSVYNYYNYRYYYRTANSYYIRWRNEEWETTNSRSNGAYNASVSQQTTTAYQHKSLAVADSSVLTLNFTPSERSNTPIVMSFISQNIDYSLTIEETTQQVVERTTSQVKTASFVPLRSAYEDAGGSGTNYAVSSKNTGYILGGMYKSNSGDTYNGDVRVSRYSSDEIDTSYKNKSFKTIYTVNANGSQAITNSSGTLNNNTGMLKYQTTSKQLKDILDGDTSYVYGLHFMNAAISMDHIMRAEKVTILGKTYYDYPMPEDAIDFHLKDRGTINFYAGIYYYGNANKVDSFFSLHQILRNSTTQEITAIYEIAEIYATNQGVLDKYLYKYSNGKYSFGDGNLYDTFNEAKTASGGKNYSSTAVFKTEWLKTKCTAGDLVNNAIYYFEIPVNKGEYALSSVSERSCGAYLLYLDIGANGGGAIATEISSEGVGATATFATEFRSANDTDLPEKTILLLSYEAPAASSENFSVTTEFTKNVSGEAYQDQFAKGLYTITVTNKTSKNVTLTVFLCDDDDNPDNDFDYAYRLRYINNSTDAYVQNGSYDFFKSCKQFTIPFSGTDS